ncbi:MaoC domain protein dehydratase [Desulfatibacillum aliphaticivorans]|uniref:MaoC domain protein dehydratase n=1 Tax=Desulfatibacillum aliphaticivorans TaxID=218208 RepID=B8FDA1_DESAL|nr:MaoC/PaaZ C-terminal domain-containing protein [Desulfatibacillum aliphaticivorans]ACL06532.1 MaoC domain protein dehydratase [Desulfatibacillum aliphaticivorans]
MRVSPLYARHQIPVIMALLKTAAGPVLKKISLNNGGQTTVVEAVLPPRPQGLIEDYLRHVGGEPSWYKGTVPPSLFPQWGFPLMAKTLTGLPYNLTKVLNGGASFVVHAPIPADRPLKVRAELAQVDETESRVVLQQKMVTGVEDNPECLECTVNAIIPKKSDKKGGKQKALIPQSAQEIATLNLALDSGIDFALLTGDFNPIHWIPSYARMAGFPNTILHGFSSMARTIEALNRNVLAQNPYALKSFECRFVRPLVLPAAPGVFVDKGAVFLGAATGSAPYLSGAYTV